MARKSKYVTDAKTFNDEYERVVKLRQELKSAKDECENLIAELNESTELPEQVLTHIADLKSELSTIQAAYTTTTTYINEIKDYKDNFDTIKNSIDEELTEATEQNKALQGYIKDTTDLIKTIKDETKRSATLLDDARNTLKIITDSSLSSVFIERSNDRKKARRWWLGGVSIYFILFVVALYFIIVGVATDPKLSGNIGTWILKIAITAPFIYLLYFVTRQYSHERDLEEKYAFKALISQTISNNTKLLKDEFEAHAARTPAVYDKMLDFTIESLRSIYSEPFRESTFTSKIRFSPKNTDVSAEVVQKEK